MARIFITGSADGLGQMAAALLISQGHQVVLHARNAGRGRQALLDVPGAENVLTADLSNIEETKQLAADVNALGSFDAIIHNAGVYQVSGKLIFSVNTLAPYILTALIQTPKRLIYLTSGMHLSGHPNLNFNSGGISYSDSKLYVLMLSMAVARKWPEIYSNAVDPGWVPTKMGGAGAPDNLEKGFETQAWLAVSNDEKAKVTGRYFHHKREARHHPQAGDISLQDRFLALCEQATGVPFPTS
ncbi:NAD(P)-dependent dehydrogenase, short-chain alcohol dehydrogenase family [Chryseolinea serpens]|uniref:NAD(P)-dependent dehydrogenase, short-chain alcohol dehydrogenase family n=1 Tax=Chryseolinea serpens TaxID=947013 RepID=A0A1M5QWW5_9BACT|nr:SDR family NAD(P)-dependent oxidoreductase [Chryseolinea serpens]SHH18240.1 NAD(P)-dependent dehydrogenase, short-chain alcohol dehydrogenase family [Chryseolinea serpens]